jgi:hypothetical protein
VHVLWNSTAFGCQNTFYCWRPLVVDLAPSVCRKERQEGPVAKRKVTFIEVTHVTLKISSTHVNSGSVEFLAVGLESSQSLVSVVWHISSLVHPSKRRPNRAVMNQLCMNDASLSFDTE